MMMLRCFLLFATLLFINTAFGQDLTGNQLLQKAIEYHDPNGSWSSFKGRLSITMNTPDGKERVSDITIDLLKQYFHLTSTRDRIIIEQTLNQGECKFLLNGSPKISKEDKKNRRLTCERANMIKNYGYIL